MTIVLTSVATARTGSSQNPAFAAPASVGSTSIVLLSFFLDGATTISTLPGTFLHAPGSPLYNNVNSHSLNVLWARNPAGSTYTPALSGNAYSEGCAFCYDGCITSGSPWDTNSGTGAAIATDPAAGTVTPSVSMVTQAANEMGIHVVTDWGGGSWSATSGGFTKEFPASGMVGLNSLFDKLLTAAGSTGSVTATSSVSDKRSAWLGALIPAGAASGPPPNGFFNFF